MTQDQVNLDWAYDIARRRTADSQLDHIIWQDAKRGTYMVMTAERGSPYPGTWLQVDMIRP